MPRKLQPPPAQVVADDVSRALKEDIGGGDCTARLIRESAHLETRVISREIAVQSGRPWFDETFRQLEPGVTINWMTGDGDKIHPDQEICRLSGPARSILTGERSALNFLQLLSGTATRTHQFVEAVAGSGATILDTRKTIPGLRLAQKYAVRCGGGSNHRMGLYDAILIKENHISAAGSISAAVSEALRLFPGLMLEVEVENLEQLEEAQSAGAARALLDNFSLPDLEAAVTRCKGKIGLEASGGIDLETIRPLAATGVDYISVGDITKSVRATDFSMRFL
jgi:nicotinate-nucleotide pyrophosphorylase (carboxylating)